MLSLLYFMPQFPSSMTRHNSVFEGSFPCLSLIYLRQIAMNHSFKLHMSNNTILDFQYVNKKNLEKNN